MWGMHECECTHISFTAGESVWVVPVVQSDPAEGTRQLGKHAEPPPLHLSAFRAHSSEV